MDIEKGIEQWKNSNVGVHGMVELLDALIKERERLKYLLAGALHDNRHKAETPDDGV